MFSLFVAAVVAVGVLLSKFVAEVKLFLNRAFSIVQFLLLLFLHAFSMHVN